MYDENRQSNLQRGQEVISPIIWSSSAESSSIHRG